MSEIEPVVSDFSELTDALKSANLKVAIESNQMTPSRGFIAESSNYLHEKKRSLDVLIAASKNHFVYNDSEIKIMEADLFQCQELGVDGVFIGALNDKKELDVEAMDTLTAASGGMELFLSAVFDKIPERNWDKTLDWLSQHNFTGVIAKNRLIKLGAKLANYPNLRLLPFTKGSESLTDVEQTVKAPIILHQK